MLRSPVGFFRFLSEYKQFEYEHLQFDNRNPERIVPSYPQAFVFRLAVFEVFLREFLSQRYDTTKKCAVN